MCSRTAPTAAGSYLRDAAAGVPHARSLRSAVPPTHPLPARITLRATRAASRAGSLSPGGTAWPPLLRHPADPQPRVTVRPVGHPPAARAVLLAGPRRVRRPGRRVPSACGLRAASARPRPASVHVPVPGMADARRRNVPRPAGDGRSLGLRDVRSGPCRDRRQGLPHARARQLRRHAIGASRSRHLTAAARGCWSRFRPIRRPADTRYRTAAGTRRHGGCFST